MLNFQIILSHIAATKIMVLVVMVVSAALYFLNYKKDSLLVLFSSSLAIIITYLLKTSLKIPRPENMLVAETSYRFPSGHATMAAVIMILTAFFAYKYIKNRFSRYLVILLGVLWWVLIVNNRLYLGVHVPVDVFCGSAIGMLSALFVIKNIDYIYKKINSML